MRRNDTHSSAPNTRRWMPLPTIGWTSPRDSGIPPQQACSRSPAVAMGLPRWASSTQRMRAGPVPRLSRSSAISGLPSSREMLLLPTIIDGHTLAARIRSWVRLALIATNSETTESMMALAPTTSSKRPRAGAGGGLPGGGVAGGGAVGSVVIARPLLLSGGLHDPQRVVPLAQQLGLACPGRVQVRFLDVAVAADVLGDAGDLRGEVDVARVQLLQQPAHGAFVVLDQLALHAPLFGAPEHVQRPAAQEAQLQIGRASCRGRVST